MNTEISPTKQTSKHVWKEKLNQLRLFKFKNTYLRASINLQTALAAEGYLVEGPLLEEQPNVENLYMLWAEIWIPSISIIGEKFSAIINIY
jgi:hypothetical protein